MSRPPSAKLFSNWKRRDDPAKLLQFPIFSASISSVGFHDVAIISLPACKSSSTSVTNHQQWFSFGDELWRHNQNISVWLNFYRYSTSILPASMLIPHFSCYYFLPFLTVLTKPFLFVCPLSPIFFPEISNSTFPLFPTGCDAPGCVLALVRVPSISTQAFRPLLYIK